MKFSIKVIFLSLLLSNLAYAQTASILPPAKTTFFDQNGKPLTAGTVDFYTPSTTTRKTTWQDAAESIPNANPVVLDAAGRALILGSGDYRQVVKDRLGNIIWDQVTSSPGGSGGGGIGTGDGTAVGTIMPFAGMVAPTNYAFAYGEELSRTTYNALLAAITNTFSAVCVSGNPTLTGITDTTQLNVGASIEGACIAASSVIISKTSTSVTMNNNAIIGVTTSVTFFNFGNGNASTTFNVPDLRGYGVVGRCNMGGASCSVLTSTYFGADPNATGIKGGSQNSTLITANLPPYTPAGSVTIPAQPFTDPVVFFGPFAAGGTGLAYLASNVGASGQQPVGTPVSGHNTANTGTLVGTAAPGQISTPFSNIAPEISLNYIIKIFPDISGGGGGGGGAGVTSIGGQSGIIVCGGGITCAGNTISASAFTSQNANLVLAGPTTGSPAAPTFRSLTLTDLPALGTMASENSNSVSITGGAISGTTLSGNTITGGTISGSAAMSGSTIASSAMSGGTITGTAISGGTISGSAAISSSTIASSAITGSTIASTPINAASGNITNVTSPTNAGDAANKGYVDLVAGTGVNPLPQSRLATAAILPNTPTYANGTLGVSATLTAGSNSTLTVDGSVAALNDVVLVKNQASSFQNGVYTVTTAGSGAAAWVLTRATYFDQAAEMKNNSFTVVTAGSTNISTSWIMSPAVATVGTDPSSWTLNSTASTNIAVGTTTISGGTTTRIPFDNAGVVGEYAISGTGNVAMTTSPTIASPTLTGTITATNLITNTNLAQAAAATIKGNPTTSTANEQDFTLSGLTARTVPDVANDQLMIFNSASGAINKITPTALGIGAAGVTSIAGNTGAFTLNSSKGITNATNSIQTTFTQTGTGAVATDLVTRTKQLPVTPWDFTSSTIDDGTTSASAAIQAAINTGKDVYLPKPATCYLITSDLVMNASALGQEIYGDGRGVPTLCIKSTGGFTNGVFKCNGIQPGSTFRDFAATFTQPVPIPSASTTGTISGSTMTLASGTGVAVGQVVGSVNNLQPGLTIVSGSGTTWTLSFTPTQSPYSGAIVTYSVAALRAQLNQYKPLIYCQNSARVSVRHVLVNTAWDAFDFRGNSGGLEMLDIQYSAFNQGIQLDGSLDSVRLTDIQCWPFVAAGDLRYDALVQTPGIPSAPNPTGGATCISAGRVDGMTMTNVTTAIQLGLHMFHGTAFTAGDATITCNGCDFDTFNGGIQDSGVFMMNGGAIGIQTGATGWVLTGTNSTAKFSDITTTSQTFGSLFLMEACNLCVMSINQLNHTGSVNTVTYAGVTSDVINSNFWLTNSYFNVGSSQLIAISALPPTTGVNNFHITNNIFQTTPNIAFTNPLIWIQGTCGSNVNRSYIIGNRTIDKGTGAGTFITKSCQQFDIIQNNIAPGWSYSLPSGIGIYTPNL